MSDAVARVEALIAAAFADMMEEEGGDFTSDLVERALDMAARDLSTAARREMGGTLITAINDMAWKAQLHGSGHVFDLHN